MTRTHTRIAIKAMLPPPRPVHRSGEFIAGRDVVRLATRFPALPPCPNPMDPMQGGSVPAALDDAFGPFSSLVARQVRPPR